MKQHNIRVTCPGSSSMRTWSLKLSIAVISAACMAGVASAETIRMGFIGSLTGPGALVGEAAQAGVELAVGQINDKGGINGKRIELIIADDQTNPTAGVNETKRLLQQAKVDVIIGPAYSQVTLATLPLMNQARVASINGSGIEQITPEIAPYSFSNLASSDAQAKLIAHDVKTRLKARSAAIISDTGAQAKVAVKSIEAGLKKEGVEVTGIQEYQYGSSDMTPQLLDLRRGKPEALVLFATTGDDTGHVLKGLQEIGWDIGVSGSYGTSLADAGIKIAGIEAYKNLAGINYSSWAFCTEGDLPEANQRMIDGLKVLKPSAFERLPYNYISLWYDSVYLIRDAIEGARGSLDGPEIAKWIEENSHSYEGVNSHFNASSSNHFLIGENNLAMIIPADQWNGMQRSATCP